MGLLLLVLLVNLSWSVLSAARGTAARLTDRAEALGLERVGWHVLSREIAAGVPGRDWALASERVLPLRAFRGVAQLCGGASAAGGGLVRPQGMRDADPEKDSLLLLTTDGAWRAAKLTGRLAAGNGCGGGVEIWSWHPPVADVLLARLFESGSYHLEDRAIRYRLGAAGRQPLTEERLDAGSAFLRAGAGLRLRLHVRVDDDVTWRSERQLTTGSGPDA